MKLIQMIWFNFIATV